jgi:hypothetical protein
MGVPADQIERITTLSHDISIKQYQFTKNARFFAYFETPQQASLAFP